MSRKKGGKGTREREKKRTALINDRKTLNG